MAIFASSTQRSILPCVSPPTLAACGGDPPEKEMQQAQAAIDVAVAAGAETYAAQELAAAEAALTHAGSAVAARDYRLALNHALDSRQRALNATRSTVSLG